MSDMNQKTILLVEDETITAMMETYQLESEGYRIIQAKSGEEAINVVCDKKEPVDLILMDIDLGEGIDGTEAAQEILREHNIPVLFLSSHTEKEVVEKTEKITSYGYVVKNSEFAVLDASIKMAFKLFNAYSDIRAQKMHIEKVYEKMQAAEILQKSEQRLDKELILKRVHHRVKNNMNTIFCLLTLQADAHRKTTAGCVLQDAAGRVRSMILLYDKLYRTENICAMSIREYFPVLIEEIVSIFLQSVSIKTQTQIDDIILNANVLSSLGIIINELITNSIKYAFNGRNEGLITVRASRKEDRILIVFEDDGSGIPENITFENSSGFGLRLVKMLIKKIDGSITIERDHGTRFIIEFKA